MHRTRVQRDNVRRAGFVVTPSSPSSSVPVPGFPGADGEDGEAGFAIPGQPGGPGAPGQPGSAGAPGFPGADGEDGETGLSIPGLPGAAGVAGPPGLSVPGPPGSDADEPDSPLMIPGPPGPGSVANNFIVNLGASRNSGTFDLTGLAGLQAGKNVMVKQSANPIPSKGNARDEFELDDIQATGYVVDPATIRVYWNAHGRTVVGDYAFFYAVLG